MLFFFHHLTLYAALYPNLLQDVCYRESVESSDGTVIISRGCKPLDECPDGSMTDELPGRCSTDDDGTKTCVNCDYFDEEAPPETPWHLCEKPRRSFHNFHRFNL